MPRRAIESTKRLLNMQLEKNVLTTLDYATTSEELTFGSDDFKAIVTRLTEGKGQ